ncbi:MAG: hypothetical protein KGN76_06440 [Acidobacteriota bacterium]|nr:hypothetical protein [Acidobacteriota bacterium]
MPFSVRTYRLADLVMASNRPLPELVETGGEPADWTFVAHPSQTAAPRGHWFHQWRLPSRRLWLSLGRAAGGEYLLRFHHLADFELDVGERRIACHPTGGTAPATIRHLLLDQVMPLVLGTPPRLALHASAVRTPQGVVAFVGPAGAGKSTLAAALGRSGWDVMADDCLIVETMGAGAVQAVPSYQGLRLWQDSLRALYAGPRPRGRRVAGYTRKQRLDAAAAGLTFCSAPAPLARLYVLGRSRRTAPAVQVERLSPREAVIELLRFTFHLDVEDRPAVVARFDRAARIAERVSIRRLRFQPDLNRLDQWRAAVQADMASAP